MPDEIRIPVNVKIPQNLHDSILTAVEKEDIKIKRTVLRKLEKLLHNTQEEVQENTEVLQGKENDIQNL
jgi:hypothetical protein